MQDTPQNNLNIELTEEIAEGIYSNLAIITHNNSEFVVDFVNIMPKTPKPQNPVALERLNSNYNVV